DKLLDVADELVAWDQTHGRSYTTAMALPFKAHVLATRGDTDAAAALVDDFMDRAREIADPQVVAPAAVAAAFIEHVRGDGEAARPLSEARAVFERLEARPLAAEAARLLAAAAAQTPA